VTRVLVVGAGLLGTSIGLGLKAKGHTVQLTDKSSSAAALAADYGAGEVLSSEFSPEVIFICVPPEETAQSIIEFLEKFPKATVSDVASVKASIEKAVATRVNSARFIPGHPMAGRERGGAIAGRSDLFVARPWILCPGDHNEVGRLAAVESLIAELGASVVKMSASDHDRAVALVSHVPQAVSSLLAARLAEAEAEDIALAGAGLRDTTRIAASSPELWLQIYAANSLEVNQELKAFRADLDRLIVALDAIGQPGSLAAVNQILDAGNRGVAKIPGKHGSKAQQYQRIVVMIDDRPGELGRLFNEVGALGVNIEELQLEHSPSAQIGLVELFVLPKFAEPLVAGLQNRGWRIAG
jgi:prephenate dehydrogenase